MSNSPAVLRSVSLALLIALIGACAGNPRMDIAGNGVCPELSGSYCANGQRWEKGESELEHAFLPYILGVERRDGWPDVDRVDIEGASKGTLTITLRIGETEFDKAEITQPTLVCGNDVAAVRMQTLPWGGAGPILALGASAGWRLLKRHQDGSLRVEEQRKESGTVFFVIPLRLNSESSLKFSPYEQGECVR